MKHFHDVGDFHHKFGLHSVSHDKPGPRAVPQELIDFRLKFLIEELKETAEGMGVDLEVQILHREERYNPAPHKNHDILAVADGLVDLSYVTLGTAHVFGLPWEDLFAEVQRANMSKERAVRPDQSTRRSTFDVVKPAGWKAPDIAGVLRRHGWSV